MKKSSKTKSWGDATLAIHTGEEKFRVGAPVGTSIARTSNFTFASTEEMKRWAEGKSSAYIYSRYGNPTLAIAEKKIAALEGSNRDAAALRGKLPAFSRCVAAAGNRGASCGNRLGWDRAARGPAD
jgi:O-acetylhomoserine/O-acetylserine sulfhydrylase-like pyridoxal-dependent enzyme